MRNKDARADFSGGAYVVAKDSGSGLLIEADAVNDVTLIDSTVANDPVRIGSVTATDLQVYDTAGNVLINCDASAGTVSVRGLIPAPPTAGAITAATVLTASDMTGGVFSVSQAAAYDIDLPVAARGYHAIFYLTGPAANNVTITVAAAASSFVGTIQNDVTSTIPATGATLTFATGASVLGDSIEVFGISATLYLVRASTSANGGITVA